MLWDPTPTQKHQKEALSDQIRSALAVRAIWGVSHQMYNLSVSPLCKSAFPVKIINLKRDGGRKE